MTTVDGPAGILETNPDAATADAGGRTSLPRWWFRWLAVACGLGPFVLVELLCIACGWGEVNTVVDPFVGFVGQRPLFALSDDGTSWHTAENRRGFFKEDSFDAIKPAGEFRIFVFGGSTVQGNPFSMETSFPTYLQVALSNACPSRRWKVINCGGVSYASYRLLPVMQECLAYQPDLFIFCEGHNEFLEDVEYTSVVTTASVGARAFKLADHLRSFRLLQRLVATFRAESTAARNESTAGRPLLPIDVDTRLDHDGGLAAYHRDDNHASIVAAHFRSNLERMSELCSEAGLPLLFILPPSNLTDCPPFKSEFSATTTDDQRRQLTELLAEARQIAASDAPAGASLARTAVQIDPRYALGWYELAQLQLLARDPEAAASFLMARDEDVCPLRMTSALENVVRAVARETGRPLLDAHSLLAERCPDGLVGGSVLVDHVHPSFRGHEDIAIAIAEGMIRDGFLIEESADWSTATHDDCAARRESLDDMYFLRGQRALESLRLWAAGRSGGPPLEP